MGNGIFNNDHDVDTVTRRIIKLSNEAGCVTVNSPRYLMIMGEIDALTTATMDEQAAIIQQSAYRSLDPYKSSYYVHGVINGMIYLKWFV